jgi:hypothetical protein
MQRVKKGKKDKETICRESFGMWSSHTKSGEPSFVVTRYN